ncbi:MAG: Hsp20/alpha crystallin family protein [Bacteroidetes bacterium]|nr:Hsp20/alpha crystallin family protein [Bacteroidota bacterium]
MNTLMKTNGNLFPTLLSDFFGASPVLSPNLFDVDLDLLPSRLGIYQIQLAAPGLAKKDFKIETDNGVLTISAEKEEKAESKNGYARTEYSFNSFSRSFTLPENSKPDNINAKYEDGILKLTVPKKEITSVKPKKEIAVS